MVQEAAWNYKLNLPKGNICKSKIAMICFVFLVSVS